MKRKTAIFFKNWVTIDHITHIDNLKGILKHGLLAHNNPYRKVDISNQDVNARRDVHEPIYDHSIHEYVPLYFNPRNAMLYRNQNEHGNNIIVLGVMPEILLLNKKVIITDGNASRSDTLYDKDIDFLSELQWDHIESRSWGDDYELKGKMMAETLVYKKIDIKYLKVIYCQTKEVMRYIEKNYNIPKDVRLDHEEFEHIFFRTLI